MKKEKIEKHIIELITDQEKLEGYFQAQNHYTFWDYIKIGMSDGVVFNFYVAVTDIGLHFVYIDEKDQVDRVDFYPYQEISSFKAGSGFMQRPLKFSFSQGDDLKIKAQLKGLEVVPKYTDRIESILHEKIGR